MSVILSSTNVPIHERVCVGPLPYYLYWFEKYYPNVPLNLDDGLFYPQCMNGIQGTNPARRQWNRLLNSVVKIMRYNKITIDHAIYIKVFSDVTVSYITVSTDYFLNTTNNETVFPELRRVLKKHLRLKSKNYFSLTTWLFLFFSLLLDLVLIRLITSPN